MPLFFTQQTDLYLVGVAVAMVIAGVTIYSASRNTVSPAIRSAMGRLGGAFFILAFIECVSVYGLAEDKHSYYHSISTVLYILCCIPLWSAARCAALPGDLLARLRGVPSLATAALAAAAAYWLFAKGEWSHTDSFLYLKLYYAAKFFFFLSSLALALQFQRNKAAPGDVLLVIWLMTLYTFVSFISPYPADPTLVAGTSGAPVRLPAPLVNFFFALYLMRVAIIFAVALLLWNIYTKAMGALGQMRWWPLATLLTLVACCFVLVHLVQDNYRTVVASDFSMAARNAAATIVPESLLPSDTRAGDEGEASLDRIFNKINRLRLVIGYSDVPAEVAIVRRSAADGLPRIIPSKDRVEYPLAERHQALWDRALAGEEAMEGLYEPTQRAVYAMAPVMEDSGKTVGASLVRLATGRVTMDMFHYRRLIVLAIPLAFFLMLFMIRGQLEAWLAARSASRREALRLGALGHDLVGVAITRGEIVTDINQRLLDIFQEPRENIVGKDLLEALRADPLPGNPDGDPIRAALSRSDGFHYESTFRPPSGKVVHCLVYVRRLTQDPDDDALIWEGVDITLMKEMEEQLRSSRDFLQSVIDAIPVAVFVKDLHGHYRLANQAFAKLMGVSSPQTLIDHSFDNFQTSKALGEDGDSFCRMMRGETLVYDQLLDDGSAQRFYEVSKSLGQFGESGNHDVIIGTAHDFTTKKKFSDAISRERHFLLHLLNTMPVATCFVDAKRIVRLANIDFARECDKKSPSDIIGRPYDDVAPFPEPFPGMDERLIEEGLGRSECEFETRRDGKTRNLVLRRTVMTSADGSVIGLVKTFWDTTALAAANRAALAAARAKSAFLSNMSHEVRTPMNGIVGMADIILETEGALPESRFGAETILKSAKTLQMVMDEIMEIAGMDDDAQRYALSPGAVNLLELTEEMAQIESCIVEAWGVELSLDFDLGLAPSYNGDARRIRQILVQVATHCAKNCGGNLLRLAVKPEPAAGSRPAGIRFSAAFSPKEGIDAKTLEAQFKTYADPHQKDDYSRRLGVFDDRIGLPLAWRLIRSMSGSLEVTDGDGKIACQVFLPLAPSDNSPARIPAPDLSGLRIVAAAANLEYFHPLKDILDYAGAELTMVDSPEGLTRLLEEANEKGRAFELAIVGFRLKPKGQLSPFLSDIHGDRRYGSPKVILVTPAWEIQPRAAIGGDLVASFISLPICPTDVWAKVQNARRPAAVPGKKHAAEPTVSGVMKFNADVLLVEDNPVNQTVGAGILARAGCRAVVAKNGAEAVEKIVSGATFDLILMDCMMPVMDGYEASSRIRRHEREHPGAHRNIIVALTANAAPGEREHCLAVGMDDYMTKPVTLEAMRNTLLRHCPALMTLASSRKTG